MMRESGRPTMADRAFFYSLQGLPYEDIGRRLGVTQGQARRLVYAGQRRAAVTEAAE
jgi:DNA-directed RNA polymerase specialized sigma24 family protein